MPEFNDWYQAQRPRVMAACCALGGDLHAAREATDEAFARAFERWSVVSTMGSPGGWVQTVALNELRSGLRRRNRFARFLRTERTRPTALTGDPSNELPDADLWRAVGALPARQQTAVVLRYVHDLPEAEVATLMGVTRGTVASTLAAARANLASALPDHRLEKETAE